MFELTDFMGRRILKSSYLEDGNAFAFFTTSDLPLKYGEREDLKDQIEENKKLVAEGLKIPPENLIIPQQTHSDNVKRVKGKRKKEKENISLLENTDALVTNEPNIALALNFADCVPILFYDPVKKIVAAAHAGWKGTVKKIGIKTAEKMVKEFNSKPSDIIALIGPAIGECCFEVGEDVKEKLFKTIDKSKHSEVCENNHLNLKLINKLQLLDFGLEKIDVCEYCTSCQSELFFSYRREKGNTARHSAVIILK